MFLSVQDSYSYVRSTASAVGYDSKQYYQQPTATAAVAAAQPQPSVAESYYQSGTSGPLFSLHNDQAGNLVKPIGKVPYNCGKQLIFFVASQLLNQRTVRG